MDVTAEEDRRHDCRRVTPVLNRVGDKWSMQVVMELASGQKRFSELKRALDGVSQRMLTLTLRGLERDGLVSRHVTPSIPPRVDYELTELGISLREPVKALGHMVELYEQTDRLRDFYSMVARAADGWTGDAPVRMLTPAPP